MKVSTVIKLVRFPNNNDIISYIIYFLDKNKKYEFPFKYNTYKQYKPVPLKRKKWCSPFPK